jgi:general secretion pathway protein K
VRPFRRPDAGSVGRSRGIALLAVLWFVVLLSLIATAFLSVSRSGIREAELGLSRARVEALAESGVELAILMLLEPSHHQGLQTDGGKRVLRLGGDRVTVSIQDVGGQIDLNEADEPLLRALFRSVGTAEDRAAALAAAVADWRDPDGERSSSGAEAQDYARARVSPGPANRPFYAVSELAQVLGVDPVLYAKVAPSLTVHSGSPDVDGSVAPPAVRAALKAAGMEIEGERDGTAASPKPRFGLAVRGGGAVGRNGTPLPPSETDTYAVKAAAELANGARFVREAVVILTGDRRRPYTVLVWGTPAAR